MTAVPRMAASAPEGSRSPRRLIKDRGARDVFEERGESMSDRIFSDREKAMEADYFRKEEARLLEMLRKNASLDEIAEALRDKLQVDNPDLLVAVRDLGITPETVAA